MSSTTAASKKTAPQAPARPPADSMRRHGKRVLVALSEDEHREFFGHDIGPLLPAGVSCRHFSPAAMTAAQWEAALAESAPSVLISCWSTPMLPDRIAGDRGAPLSYVGHVTGSVRTVVPRRFLERGGLVTNWGGLASQAVAEHALLLALSSLRNQGEWRTFIEQDRIASEWHSVAGIGTRTLFKRRVGLHGFGQIARALARLLRPFDVEICAYSEGVPPALMRESGVTPAASLRDLFSRSDVLFECEALTQKTEKCVDAGTLAALPDNAVFVNVGRGKVVDEPALYAEAAGGRLHFALDVTAADPLRPDSKLLALPNVILSPHIGGPTFDRYRSCGRFAMENLLNYLGGKPVSGQITLEVYDRST
jgi:phosphoglycerate dehydrogenase-like enzyme